MRGSTPPLTRRRIDTACEIDLGLYQAITGPEERQKLFRELSRGFFDLIVIDECHRGSAAEDSAWREILEYFSAATRIGLTATPRETRYVSNIDHFGPPVYTCSLKQGIRDGFLAPCKVVKVHIDRDVEGYRPEKGRLDRDGNEVEDRIYNNRDFDRVLVLDERTRLVARKVTAFLKESGNRFRKTIFFCIDQEHAGRMRQALINENADLVGRNHRCVMRIAGNDVRKRNAFARHGDQARAVLDALLAKYADEGVLNLDDATVLRIPPFTEFGTPVQLVRAFGGRDAFVAAVQDLQSALYREVA